jgi:hypothetical protein
MSSVLLQILGLIQSSINNNNSTNVRKLLQKLPLEDMEDSEIHKILIFCLNNASNTNSVECVVEILNLFDSYTPDNETVLDTFTTLFTLRGIDDSVLSFLICNIPTVSYEYTMEKLINYDSSSKYAPVYERIDSLFYNTDLQVYKRLLEYSISKNNSIAIDFFTIAVCKNNNYAPVPEWVIREITVSDKSTESDKSNDSDNFYSSNDILTGSEILSEFAQSTLKIIDGWDSTNLPIYNTLIPEVPELKVDFSVVDLNDTTENVRLLSEGLMSLGIGIDNLESARNEIRKKLNECSEAEKMQLLEPILINNNNDILQRDSELFKYLGPANPHFNSDVEYPHICYKYGGCRMLTCTCFEIDSDDIPLNDWFTGVCNVCLLKIRSRAHAIRKPLSMGGFVGCFCSFECLRKHMTISNMVNELMIDKMESDLLKFKIIDRREIPGSELISINNRGFEIPGISETY